MDDKALELGAFSVSLAVKDLQKSREFYTNLGFSKFGGDGENYLILKNGTHLIGLFQGMFDQNILTFNPGWDQSAGELPSFTDIRDIEAALKARDMPLSKETETASGPDSITLIDPDGNVVLIDQHR